MKYNDNGEYKDIYVKTFDTLPVGTEVDYDGETVPSGWTEVADPNAYSTNEVKIGTWLGSPLYRKVIEVSGVSTDIAHNITNLSKVVRAYGYFTRTFQNVLSQTIPHTDIDTSYVVDFNFFDTTKIYMIIGSGISSTISGMVLVLEYTKSTN